MKARIISCALVAAVTLVITGTAAESHAQQPLPAYSGRYWQQTTAPLFSNYYVQPHVCGGVPAQMYISPVPTPAYVGHTNVTNQAFMPHEYMYKHKRIYYKWHRNGGNYTKTKVWFW